MSRSEDTVLTEGSKAPVFSLPGSNGKAIKLSDLAGAPVVLYFYPKDDTPGCTVEAQEFRDLDKEFRKMKTIVLGISPDSIESHCKFAEEQNLSFTLLADDGHVVADQYGVWGEKSMYGRKYMGIIRTTFLIDKSGKIVKVWTRVTPRGHAKKVLEAVKTL